MDSLASIIVPCYNGEKFVDRCFDSILKQKYAHMEVIVVNDGSTDQSELRVLAWNDRFRNAGIQLVYVSQENKGPGGAINTGLKHVTGEYLCLLDIDDELLESAVSTRVAFLKSHPDIDVVRSNGWYNRKSGKSLFIYDEKEKNIDLIIEELKNIKIKDEKNITAYDYLKRTEVSINDVKNKLSKEYDELELEQAEIMIKYEGYIKRQLQQVEQFKKMENKLIPDTINYDEVHNLRTEAVQKLKAVHPHSVGQASRISGVSPSDISVLMIYMEQIRHKK